MSSTNPSLNGTFQHLREVRLALLRLHKALLDSERAAYEQSHSQIKSNTEFFQLVIDHEWFSWLRPISQLIVQIDAAFDAKEPAKEPMTLSQAKALLVQVRELLQPAEQGTASQQRYYQAIQRDPNIAFMHAELSKLLATKIQF